jgi:hypothetical protein
MNETIIEDEGEIGSKIETRARTQKELKELALGIRGGSVFGSWMIPEHQINLIPNVFMALMFMNDIHRKMLKRDEVVQFYGYMKDAGPLGINGLPIFYDVHYLTKPDVEKLNVVLKKLEDFMGSDSEEPAQ